MLSYTSTFFSKTSVIRSHPRAALFTINKNPKFGKYVIKVKAKLGVHGTDAKKIIT